MAFAYVWTNSNSGHRWPFKCMRQFRQKLHSQEHTSSTDYGSTSTTLLTHMVRQIYLYQYPYTNQFFIGRWCSSYLLQNVFWYYYLVLHIQSVHFHNLYCISSILIFFCYSNFSLLESIKRIGMFGRKFLLRTLRLVHGLAVIIETRCIQSVLNRRNPRCSWSPTAHGLQIQGLEPRMDQNVTLSSFQRTQAQGWVFGQQTLQHDLLSFRTNALAQRWRFVLENTLKQYHLIDSVHIKGILSRQHLVY